MRTRDLGGDAVVRNPLAGRELPEYRDVLLQFNREA